MKRVSLIILVVAMGVLNAQSLNMRESIDKALKTHPDVQRYALQIKSAQSGVDVARADYLPQVTLSAEYDPIRTYVLPTNGVFNIKESDGWAVGATLNQKIWDFSKTTSIIKAQKVAQEISSFNLVEAKAFLAYKVKLQYELMLVQRVAIDVRKKDLEVKEGLYEQARTLVKNGMKTNADAYRFISSVYVAKDNLAIAKAGFKKAKTIVSLYINEPIKDDVILENTLAVKTEVVMDIQAIAQSSPVLLAAKKSVQKSELIYKATKAIRYGSLDAVASYVKQGTLNEYDTSLVGITLKIPLYSGGRNSAFMEQARLSKHISKVTLEAKELAFKEELESLVIDLNRYEKTIKAKEAQLEASQQIQTLLEARYKEGLSTYLEILDASSLTLDANLGLLQALYERSIATHRIEYLQGKSI